MWLPNDALDRNGDTCEQRIRDEHKNRVCRFETSTYIFHRLLLLYVSSSRFQLSKDLKHCDASIRVNSTLKMAGDQIAVINRLVTPVAWLHLGGIPQEFAKNDAIGSGFVGCMKNLKASKNIDADYTEIIEKKQLKRILPLRTWLSQN